MAHLVPVRVSRQHVVWLLAPVAAAAGLALPPVGIPIIAGLAVYAGITFSRPDRILRGRTLSPSRQRRIAVLAGGAMLGFAASFSGAASALKLAAALELRLRDQIEAAQDAGTARAGRTFRECERIVCAQATIIQPPTSRTLGIAKLSGFALHDEAPYGWRSASAGSPITTPRTGR